MDSRLDEIQVEESFILGADALLLIARLLSGRQLRRLLDLCRNHGIYLSPGLKPYNKKLDFL